MNLVMKEIDRHGKGYLNKDEFFISLKNMSNRPLVWLIRFESKQTRNIICCHILRWDNFLNYHQLRWVA